MYILALRSLTDKFQYVLESGFLKRIEPSLWHAHKQRYWRWQGGDLTFSPSVIEYSDHPVDNLSTGKGFMLGLRQAETGLWPNSTQSASGFQSYFCRANMHLKMFSLVNVAIFQSACRWIKYLLRRHTLRKSLQLFGRWYASSYPRTIVKMPLSWL